MIKTFNPKHKGKLFSFESLDISLGKINVMLSMAVKRDLDLKILMVCFEKQWNNVELIAKKKP